jgi:hypothetical protein
VAAGIAEARRLEAHARLAVATGAGSTSAGAWLTSSRLIIVSPNMNTHEASSSQWIGRPNTSW